MEYALETLNQGWIVFSDLRLIERAHYMRENKEELLLIIRFKTRKIEAYIVSFAKGWHFCEAVTMAVSPNE